MQTERKRIYQLSHEELRNCLIVNYIKLGIHMASNDIKLQVIIPEVHRFNAKIWTDTFDNFFSEFADGNLPGTEKLQPGVSTYFIRLIRTAYFLREHNKKIEIPEKRVEFTEPQRAYYNLLKFCLFYNQFPTNVNWQLIFSHLVDKGHFKLYEGYEQEHFAVKEKTARGYVKLWVKENRPRIKASMNKMQLAA